MKKIIILLALIVGVSVAAFTGDKKFLTRDFIYQLSTYSCSDISNPNNWNSGTNVTLICNNVNVKACGLLNVSDSFFHLIPGSSPARYVLNDATWAISHPGAQILTITCICSGSTCYVAAVSDPGAIIRNRS